MLAILQRPAVILRVGNLHPFRLQLLDELDHLLDVVEVLPMHDQVHGEGHAAAGESSRRVRSCTHGPWRLRSTAPARPLESWKLSWI